MLSFDRLQDLYSRTVRVLSTDDFFPPVGVDLKDTGNCESDYYNRNNNIPPMVRSFSRLIFQKTFFFPENRSFTFIRQTNRLLYKGLFCFVGWSIDCELLNRCCSGYGFYRMSACYSIFRKRCIIWTCIHPNKNNIKVIKWLQNTGSLLSGSAILA